MPQKEAFLSYRSGRLMGFYAHAAVARTEI